MQGTRIRRGIRFLLFFALLASAAGCGLPKEGDISASLNKANRYWDDNALQSSLEMVKKAEDDFNLLRLSYPKSVRTQMEEGSKKFEVHIAVRHTQQAKTQLDELRRLWENEESSN